MHLRCHGSGAVQKGLNHQLIRTPSQLHVRIILGSACCSREGVRLCVWGGAVVREARYCSAPTSVQRHNVSGFPCVRAASFNLFPASLISHAPYFLIRTVMKVTRVCILVFDAFPPSLPPSTSPLPSHLPSFPTPYLISFPTLSPHLPSFPTPNALPRTARCIVD